MIPLTDLSSHAGAQLHFSRDALWALFDGNRERLNIAHECLDRHRGKSLSIRIAGLDRADETIALDDLADDAGRFANWLAARGVPPGERVAIMLEPGRAFYMSLLGTMKAGAVAVPLFTLFGTDALAARLDDCAPRLLLIEPVLADRARGRADFEVVACGDAFMGEVAARPSEFAWATGPSDLAMLQYTSGTTRQLPEAVRHTHQAVVTVAVAALYATGVRPGEVFACPSSPAWGHGLWHGTLGPLGLGASLSAWAGPFDPARYLEVLAAHGVENLSAAATHYRMMRTSGRAGAFRHALRKLSFTGEPIDGATAAFALAAFGVAVCSMYGTTEVGVILGNYPGADDIEVRPGSLGKPMPGLDVRIHDSEGRECPPGVVGEIMVRRRSKWIATKDRAHTDVDGYFYHDGRADDVIISAGWTMSAVEIEDALLKHADVAEAAAIGVADAARGQIVKAFIVSDRAPDMGFALELRELARARLGRHEYPRLVAFSARLPKTEAGKVNRSTLRGREAEGGHPAEIFSVEDGHGRDV